jgi:hypothetical protein
MSLGIVTSKIRRASGHSVTLIDGLPMVYKAGTIRFVDGTRSVDGPGTTFADAHSTIQLALTDLANISGLESTVFVRPKALGAYYTESVIASSALRGLSIVGTGNGKGGSVYQACTWRNSANDVDDSALDLRPGHASVENIHFFSRAAQSSGFGIRAYWNTGSGLNIGSSIINCGFSGDLADHPAAAGVVQSAIRFDSNEGMRVEDCVFVDCRVGIASGSTMNAWKELWIVNNHFNGLAANIAADLFLSSGLNLALIGNHFGHTVPSHAAGTMAKYVFVIGGETVEGSASGNFFASANAGYGTDNTASNVKRSGNYYNGGLMTS